jgi:Aspartyl protease
MLVGVILTPHACAAPKTEIPFQFSRNLVWIDVQVQNRGEPLHFLFDTGAGCTVLNLETAASLGLKLGANETIQGVNSRSAARWVDGFDARFAGVPLDRHLLAIDLSAASRACHRRIDGLVGVGFLEGRTVQIDYAAGKIRLLDMGDKGQPNGAALLMGTALPLRKFNDSYCVPATIAGNTSQWLRLDTGCDEAVHWAAGKSAMRKTAGTSIGLSGGSARFIPAQVELGSECCENVKTGMQTNRIFQNEDGLLGNGLLSKFVVTIDTARKTVFLQRHAQ